MRCFDLLTVIWINPVLRIKHCERIARLRAIIHGQRVNNRHSRRQRCQYGRSSFDHFQFRRFVQGRASKKLLLLVENIYPTM
jgi:hypothetical protein